MADKRTFTGAAKFIPNSEVSLDEIDSIFQESRQGGQPKPGRYPIGACPCCKDTDGVVIEKISYKSSPPNLFGPETQMVCSSMIYCSGCGVSFHYFPEKYRYDEPPQEPL